MENDPHVYLFELCHPVTGEWTRTGRLATSSAIERMGGRRIEGSGRLVFPELIGADGIVTGGYSA